GTGMFVELDNAVEIGRNRFFQTGELAIQAGSWTGPARLHQNRCHGCGHELNTLSAAIGAISGFGELQVESCDIRDTALSPDDGSLVAPAVGLFGFLVIQASVQSNNIGSSLQGLDLGDPAAVPAQRAVYLLGLFDFQVNDNIDLGFVAQILDNRFNGVGAFPVVEVAGLQINDQLWARFNRVLYNDNFCWHLNTPQRGGASVRITADSASAMGNHFKGLSLIAPIDFGNTDALYMGNAAHSSAPALGSDIRPTPQNAFNR
ncbi:MAG: hypothetical protein ACREQ1_16375, partial [Woeseiaceae bacterium]